MQETTKIHTPLRRLTRMLLPCAVRLACAFVLTGASARGVPLPLGLAFVSAAGGGLHGAFACVGAAGAAWLLWRSYAAEQIAAAILVASARIVFRGTELADKRLFMPCTAAAAAALTRGTMLLVGGGDAVQYAFLAVHTACAFGGSLLMQRCMGALSKPHLLVFSACLVFAASAFSTPMFHVGIFLAALLVFLATEESSAFALAAVCGIALDLTGAAEISIAALLGACVLLRPPAARTNRLLTALARAAVCLAAETVSGWGSGAVVFSVLPAIFAAALSGGVQRQSIRISRQERPAIARMETAALLLSDLGDTLREALPELPPPDSAVIFDRAAERVCKDCALFASCWCGSCEAYDALRGAAAPMLARGAVLRDDFPVSFLSRCRRIEALLGAINHELDGMLCRRQFRSRLLESRGLMAAQYQLFSSYLHAAVGSLAEQPRVRNLCVPQVGVCALGRRGSEISGDRGASFRTERHLHYILLCDGMGSGTDARRESTYAVRLLRGLLSANFSPDAALQMLNSVYLLRDDGAFATVDLLRIDLSTQELTLYKWGSAASYLKRGGRVEKIAAELPPPGLEGTGRAERFVFPLVAGEMLVLLSDGAQTEAAEALIRAYDGRSPKELASGIVGQGEEDDRMAVVLKLQPLFGKGA